MDSNLIEKSIIDSSRDYGKPKATMFGVNLGIELNQKLTEYSKMMGVSKSSVIKQLLIAFLKER